MHLSYRWVIGTLLVVLAVSDEVCLAESTPTPTSANDAGDGIIEFGFPSPSDAFQCAGNCADTAPTPTTPQGTQAPGGTPSPTQGVASFGLGILIRYDGSGVLNTYNDATTATKASMHDGFCKVMELAMQDFGSGLNMSKCVFVAMDSDPGQSHVKLYVKGAGRTNAEAKTLFGGNQFHSLVATRSKDNASGLPSHFSAANLTAESTVAYDSSEPTDPTGSPAGTKAPDQLFTQEQKLAPSSLEASSGYGDAVAIEGNIAVVGFSQDDSNGASSGAVHVYRRDTDGATFSHSQKLVGDSIGAGDRFGLSVAISGTTIIVGSPYDDDEGTDAGAVYVFEESTTAQSFNQVAKFKGGTAGGRLGFAVAINGSRFVAASDKDSANGASSGSAIIYKRDVGNWAEEKKLLPSDGSANSYFGSAAAISGNKVAIGARGARPGSRADAGQIYVFEENAGTWQESILVPSNSAAYDRLGYSVSISGDFVVGGAYQADPDNSFSAGSVTVWKRASLGNWTQTQTLVADDKTSGAQFGSSVSISGSKIAIGAPAENDATGSVYIFGESGTQGFTQTKKLKPPNAHQNDSVGLSVALHQETVVVGATGDDSVANNAGMAYAWS
jgi:hypothetical protein